MVFEEYFREHVAEGNRDDEVWERYSIKERNARKKVVERPVVSRYLMKREE